MVSFSASSARSIITCLLHSHIYIYAYTRQSDFLLPTQSRLRRRHRSAAGSSKIHGVLLTARAREDVVVLETKDNVTGSRTAAVDTKLVLVSNGTGADPHVRPSIHYTRSARVELQNAIVRFSEKRDARRGPRAVRALTRRRIRNHEAFARLERCRSAVEIVILRAGGTAAAVVVVAAAGGRHEARYRDATRRVRVRTDIIRWSGGRVSRRDDVFRSTAIKGTLGQAAF